MIRRWFAVVLLVLVALASAPAEARRSGGSFSSRSGFRSSPAPSRSSPSSRGYSGGYAPGRYGGGTNVYVSPGFGWGWGYGSGLGMGGGSMFGTLIFFAILGIGGLVLARAIRRTQRRATVPWSMGGDDDEEESPSTSDRAYVYKIQLGLGRSARSIQERLARFASEGDTGSEAGLAQLLQQTSVELLREKDSIRYGAADSAGPMSMTNGETKLNAWALAERSRFQVERVRGADGVVRKSDEAPTRSDDVLEYLVVTVLVATRRPVEGDWTANGQREGLEALLGALGGLAPATLLGIEVVWMPADPEDALTETDLLTSFPNLKSV